MSKEDSFGFTHLEEDDDGDDVADIGTSHLDINLQPHLPNRNSSGASDQNSGQGWQPSAMQGIDNPGMDLGEGEEGVLRKALSENRRNSSQTSSQDSHANAEHNGNVSSQNIHETQSSRADVENGGTVVSPSAVHVQYSNTDGKVNVMQGQVVTRPDGSRYIDTHGIPQHWSELDRPLRQKRIRFLKIFAIASCVFFFPLGIPAVYYAFKTEKEFHEGIMRGNIDRAQTYAKRCERLTIMAFIMSIVVAALIVAVIERPYFTDKSVHRGTIVG